MSAAITVPTEAVGVWVMMQDEIHMACTEQPSVYLYTTLESSEHGYHAT